MKKFKYIFGLVWIAISTIALAGTMGGANTEPEGWWNNEEGCRQCSAHSSLPEMPWEGVFGFSIGPGWNHNNGITQTLALQPGLQNTYAATAHSNFILNGQVFLGLQKQLNERLFTQFGLSLGAGSDATLTGDIWDNANPALNNHTYSYSVYDVRLTANGKILMDIFSPVYLPYLNGGLGVGINTSHGFTVSPANYNSAYIFSKKTKAGFTYLVGAGIQKIINEIWQAHLGYEFSDWGSNQLGVASGQTMGKGLFQNHLYIQSIQIGLTCLM